jgi:hypothetical protein
VDGGGSKERTEDRGFFDYPKGQALMMDRVLVVAAALLVGTVSHAQPNRLQERCGKQAAEVFAKRWGSGVKNSVAGQSVAEYLNHYNSRLDKCIYLEIINTFKAGLPSFMWMKLFDPNENGEIAVYSKGEGATSTFCLVQAKWCGTEAEWRTLIKPFMED